MSYIKSITVVILSFIMFGCASPANISNVMVDNAYNLEFKDEYIGKIGVIHVNGSSNTSELYDMGLENKEFKTALKESLKSQYLLAIESRPQFELTASFLNVDYPSFGSDLYFDSDVRYLLIDKVVFDSVITSQGIATMSDSLMGSTRLKIAAERSAHENIKGFLEKLSSNKK
ncbi:hypothetical protein BCU17_16660 [Vibrio splendidus]|uniref:DUF4136 domain-containing protein n=1 Tax=Vibrio splendidus TaxID=29497 RepID=A0A2N7FE50_VIBSP|nr:hypothetical protein BCU17_16660 [Vibrio splendidus]